eukprot:comp21654_c0_seq1/m.30444 comp21654_c0_seq1/g.30444  ORF comp21654_c0_seq1/g.30444 comp21654_c0_seq1/m.30444 type:complete len:484 (-) comp21654_c0_seq1:502-1953(-)
MDAATLLKLNRADEATQQARLDAVNGKNVIWISPFGNHCVWSDYGRKFYYGTLREMGINLWMVLDPTFENTQCIIDGMTQDGYMEKGGIIWANIRDQSVSVESCYEAVKKLEEEKGIKFGAVFGTGDHIQALVGGLAERLGLPSNPRTSYDCARDKFRSRDMCYAAGIAAPKYAICKNREQLPSIISDLELPFVMKPQSGAGSLGVYKCATEVEVYEAFDKITKELTESETLAAYAGYGQVHVLCEQYIDGDEFDVDLLFNDGECVYSSVTDNWPTFEPYFLENGANTPTAFPHLRQSLIDYAISVVKALKFHMGAFHVEVKYSYRWNTPMLIELNPRVGGECIRPFNKAVYGVDLLVNNILAAFGVPINPPRSETPQCGNVLYAVCADKTGVLMNDRFLDHIKGHPTVFDCEVCCKPGDKIRGLDTGIPMWVGKFQLSTDNVEDSIALAKEMIKSINLPIQKEAEKVQAEVAAAEVAELVTA